MKKNKTATHTADLWILLDYENMEMLACHQSKKALEQSIYGTRGDNRKLTIVKGTITFRWIKPAL